MRRFYIFKVKTCSPIGEGSEKTQSVPALTQNEANYTILKEYEDKPYLVFIYRFDLHEGWVRL